MVIKISLMYQHRHKFLFFFGAVFAVILMSALISRKSDSASVENISAEYKTETTKTILEKKSEPIKNIKKIEVTTGSTFGILMKDAGVDYQTTTDILQASKEIYDLVNINVGKNLELVYDEVEKLTELRYQTDTQNFLAVKKIDNSWQAELKKIEYKIKTRVAVGTITTSMYESATENDVDIRAIINFADAFQWTIDFATDPRVGDTYKFVYEERYLDGQYIMPGKVLAGEYVNDGTKYEIFYFEENEDNKGYFDAEGVSVQKMFLKAPVAFKYITSGFTTGKRYVEAFNVSTGHRAIDYAASTGTPIRSVGDGTVVKAGWNGPYGNFTSIRHNGTYTTQYAHQSKLAVKKGQKVKQGDIIGYVGSTGFSTGPHLHYEMVKNGVKINPLREVLPPGQAIKDENKKRFEEKIEEYRLILK
jgi:murein DD-endopeptidase MepM/ murein hydrolase activator NlpD